MDMDDFRRYRGDWLLWRNLGHSDENGTWVAPVSFVEALSLNKRMLNVFFLLDDIYGRMQRQFAKIKKNENKNA